MEKQETKKNRNDCKSDSRVPTILSSKHLLVWKKNTSSGRGDGQKTILDQVANQIATKTHIIAAENWNKLGKIEDTYTNYSLIIVDIFFGSVESLVI